MLGMLEAICSGAIKGEGEGEVVRYEVKRVELS
jgi:hypothetical protein